MLEPTLAANLPTNLDWRQKLNRAFRQQRLAGAATIIDTTAERGTASAIKAAGMPCKTVFKVNEGRPNATDLLKAGAVQLVVYPTTGAVSART